MCEHLEWVAVKLVCAWSPSRASPWVPTWLVKNIRVHPDTPTRIGCTRNQVLGRSPSLTLGSANPMLSNSLNRTSNSTTTLPQSCSLLPLVATRLGTSSIVNIFSKLTLGSPIPWTLDLGFRVLGYTISHIFRICNGQPSQRQPEKFTEMLRPSSRCWTSECRCDIYLECRVWELIHSGHDSDQQSNSIASGGALYIMFENHVHSWPLLKTP